jgi:Dolichyl-phosphate-mannose-protein mannosyltransferase
MSALLNSTSAPLESPLPEARIENDAGIIGERLGSAGEDLVVPAREWTDAAARGFIVLVAIVLAWYTWAHWGDIQVDCGRELYVPAEILRGNLIYRDFFYSYGPLAPYLCALLIAIFGPHLVVLYLFGIAVAIGCAIMLYELGAMLEGRAAGLTAGLALLFVGVAPNSSNYILPYSYAATIGLLLSLVCVWLTLRHIFDQNGYDLLKAGFAASMAILCKQELGAACYLMLTFVVVMEAILRRSIRPLLDGIIACAPG